MGDVIDLFKKDKPATVQTEVWSWGETFVEDGINNLQNIVAEMGEAESEAQLLALVAELRAEVETYPDTGAS